MPSASPSATATMRTSSSSEPDAEERFFATLPRYFASSEASASVASASSAAGSSAGASAALLDRRRGRVGRGSLVERLLRRPPRPAPRRRPQRPLRPPPGRGVVQQTRLDDLLRTRVAALADAGALADAAAQVVELRAPDVAAGGDLDALDLRRVHGERALHADAEGLLADGEGLADALALALDDDALEDLGPAAGALDDLEVDADAVAGLEGGDAAELRALEGVDDGAHGEENAARAGGPLAAAAHQDSEAPARLPGRGSRDCSQRATRGSRAWWPLSSTSGTAQPRQSAGRV